MTEEIKEILQTLDGIASGDWIQMLPKEANKLLDYITNLQQENETLKAKLEIGKTCGFCPYYDYKSRCEKAIEYINFVINHYKEQLETPIEDTYFDSDVNRKGYILSIIAYLQTILDTLIGSDEK